MLGEKHSGSIFRPGPKRGTGGQAAMVETAGDDQGIELQKYSDSERCKIEYENESAQGGESEAAVPEKQSVLEELSLKEISRTEEEDEEQLLFQESQAPRAHNLSFPPQGEGREFTDVSKEVQEYIFSKYSTLITDQGSGDVKEQIKRYITKYVQDYRIAVKGMDRQELVDTVYIEMAEFSFLTKYVFGTGIEEIDINSRWDIEVQYSGGVTKKLTECLESPRHATNAIRRMLHTSGMVLDNVNPAVLGHLSKNIRITAMKAPLVDEDVGIAASIRIVNPQPIKQEDLIKGGTVTQPMTDFSTECLRYRISICVAGAISSGKTTPLEWSLTAIPDNKRIYTVESGPRELALVREKGGVVTNSAIHILTQDSENERQRVGQIALPDMAPRFNPDIIVVGEMCGPEANAAQEAVRTGATVVTTTHSNSYEATYRCTVSPCKRAVDMSGETFLPYVTEAYPVVVFCKQLENRERRLMEIQECEIRPDGIRSYRPPFQYKITENRVEDGRFIIEGRHEQVRTISDGLAKRLLENGTSGEALK